MPKKTHTKNEKNKIEVFDFHPKISEFISLISTVPYLNKEIFLRELILNSSAALEKILKKEPSKPYSSKEMCIKIIPNKNNRTLTIIDTGIGMTKTDLIKNLGTIPKYDNDIFIKMLQTEDDMPLGQFGMGFYSAFLVANKVIIISKHKDDKQYLWKSNANGFTIRHDKYGEQLERGTKIVLYIKEDQVQYLEENKIKEIVKKHCHNQFFSFVEYPIILLVEKEREIELSEDETESTENKNKKKVKKKYYITEKYTEDEELNNIKPFWMRENLDIVPVNEYYEHYKLLTHDSRSKCLYNFYICIQNVQAIFYVPKFYKEKDGTFVFRKKNNIELYVKSVFIMDNCNELLPDYLNFITGIVNIENLPVNISRKILKQGILENIRNCLTSNCLDYFNGFAKCKEIYKEFYAQFGNNIKLGIQEDNYNQSKLMRLLRYYTSASGDEMCSLSDYVSRMKDNQKYIYYATGISENHITNNFHVQNMKKRGFEVIYIITNLLDLCVVDMKFDEKQFKSVYKVKCKTL